MDVRLPDGTIVKNVPEGMTQTELMARIKGPQVGMGEDVAKAIPSSAVKGLINLAGAPADIWEFLSSGAASLAGKFTSPEFAAALKEVAKPELPLPTSKRIKGAVEGVAGELYDPKTRAGKFVGGTVEAVAPAGLFGKAQAALGAVSGLASETAGAATNDNPIAKAVAGFAAPVGMQIGQAYRSIPGQMIREATGDLTPQQLEQARLMIERAKALGIDLMAPEALPPSSIQQLASDVIASKEGGRLMNQFLANRPGQVKGAVGRELLAPIGAANTPDVNMARAKQAATEVIESAERARSAKAGPFYQAAEREGVPEDAIRAVLAQVDDALKKTSDPRVIRELNNYKAGLMNEVKTPARPPSPVLDARGQPINPGSPASTAIVPETRMSSLIKTEQLNRYSNDLPTIGASGEDRVRAAITQPFDRSLADALKENNANFRQGASTYRQFTEDIINPLTAGPVGRVAGRTGYDPAVPETLRPVAAIADEKLARPESIRELYTNLNKQDPQAFPGIARTWLENAFDQAAQKVQAGDNRMVGANFAKAVFGTPQQEANFLESMKGVAVAHGKNPDDFAKGAKNLMEVLQATGKVPAAGSPTGGRLPTNEMARRSTTASGLEMISATPTGPIAKRLREWAMAGNYKRLAEILTAPDSIDQIIKIGKYKPTTTTSMALAIGLLEASGEAGSGR